MPRGHHDRTGARYERGEARHNARLTPAKVREIRRQAGTVKNIVQAAENRCSEGAIEHCIHRRTWRHVE